MAILKGQNGVVYLADETSTGVAGTYNPIADVTSFSISEEADMLETTSLAVSSNGANGRTYIPGLRQITGTIDCNLDPDNAQHMSFEVGDTVFIKLQLGGTNDIISGKVIITNSSMEITPDALVTASFDFQTNDSAGYTKGSGFLGGDIDETN